MKPAIWTGMYETLPLHEAVQILHSQGWDYFESSYEHLVIIDKCEDKQRAIEDIARTIGELGVSIPQAHALLQANVAGTDADKREDDIRTVLRHIDISAAIGAKTVVVHPGQDISFTESAKSSLYSKNVDGFRRLAEHAGEKGLRIGIENMHDAPGRPGMRAFGVYANEILELIDSIGLENVGIIIDTDHTSRQKLDPAVFIREAGKKLFGTHMSDCDGTGAVVTHRTPGAGTVEWPGVVKALKDIGYDGLFNLEIPGERHRILELRDLKSRHTCAVVNWLVNLED